MVARNPLVLVNGSPAELPAGDTVNGAPGGGGGLSGVATITVPANAIEHRQSVAATGVTGASRIFLALAPHLDTDENDPEMLDVLALSGTPSAGAIAVIAAFAAPTSGPIKINWSAF